MCGAASPPCSRARSCRDPSETERRGGPERRHRQPGGSGARRPPAAQPGRAAPGRGGNSQSHNRARGGSAARSRSGSGTGADEGQRRLQRLAGERWAGGPAGLERPGPQLLLRGTGRAAEGGASVLGAGSPGAPARCCGGRVPVGAAAVREAVAFAQAAKQQLRHGKKIMSQSFKKKKGKKSSLPTGLAYTTGPPMCPGGEEQSLGQLQGSSTAA